MDPSLDSALEQIIQKEHAQEDKLQEKREYESAITSCERSFRSELLKIALLEKNLEEIDRKGADVSARLEVAKIRSNARAHHLDTMHQNIRELRARVEKGACGVWEQRADLCTETLLLSEQCGVSALLATRARAVLVPRSVARAPPPPLSSAPQETAADRYRAASLRKEALLSRRAQLQIEPERAEHFIRLRNALNFAREKTAAILNESESKEIPTRDKGELQKPLK